MSSTNKYQHRHYRDQRSQEQQRLQKAIAAGSLHDTYVGYVQLAHIEQSLASISTEGDQQQHLQHHELYRNAAELLNYLIRRDLPGIDADALFQSASEVARSMGDPAETVHRFAQVLLTHAPAVEQALSESPEQEPQSPEAESEASSTPATGARNGESPSTSGSSNEASRSESFEIDDVSDDIVEFTTDVDVTFDDVGGYDQVKSELQDQVVERVEKRHLYEAGGFSVSGGVMLVGPPGTGKTLMARATCGEAGWAIGKVQCTNATSALFGKSAKRIEAIFQRAKEEAREQPTMLFFDEIDTLVPDRSQNMSTSSGDDQMVTAFLTEMNHLVEEDHDVVVVGASNTPEAVDSAVIDNSQRMRSIIEMDLPDAEAREKIFDVHLASPSTASTVDTAQLASVTEGFSGSDIEAVVSGAYTRVVKQTPASVDPAEMDPITQDLLEEEIEEFSNGDAGHQSYL